MSVDVAEWLRVLGLEQYATAFRANDIDGEVLPELTVDDLTGLGVTYRSAIAASCWLRSPPCAAERRSPLPRRGPRPLRPLPAKPSGGSLA